MGYLARSMKNLLDKFWTLIELHEPYKENKGEDNKHSRFLSKPISHMANEVYVFTSPGLTSIVMFKEKRPQFLQLPLKITMIMIMVMMTMFQCNVLQTG